VTEDLKNPDVLYLGTETGLFVSLDRGKSWQRLKANLPTVRIDEITLHPRDNAMLLATHGRAIWILDNLAPIQEYAAAQTATAAGRLFTPAPTAMFRRPASDRNYQFWGDQTFFGENPPQAAILSWHLKSQVERVQLKIADAAGKEVREIAGPVLANSTRPGIQSACWDLRTQPLPAPTGGAAAGRGQGGGQGGRQGGPGATVSPFGAGCGGAGGGGRGGGFGGGGGNPGPYVLPGTYAVSLVIDGKTVDTKPLRVVGDPEVMLTDAERKKLYDMAMEMHELQRRATEAGAGVGSLNTRLPELAKEALGKSDVPADLKSSIDTLQKEIATLAPKLVVQGGGRGFGGGGGGGRGGATDNLAARLAQAKNGLMGGMWPTEAVMKAYTDSKADVPKAIAEANSLFARAATLGSVLTKHSLTLTAPTPVK
jgi:hypothetical protein